jgi:hypothetical protein
VCHQFSNIGQHHSWANTLRISYRTLHSRRQVKYEVALTGLLTRLDGWKAGRRNVIFVRRPTAFQGDSCLWIGVLSDILNRAGNGAVQTESSRDINKTTVTHVWYFSNFFFPTFDTISDLSHFLGFVSTIGRSPAALRKG